jgi:hypothetical protein
VHRDASWALGLVRRDCSRRDNHSLDDDVKIILALTNTAFEAGIALGRQTLLRLRTSHKHDPLYVWVPALLRLGRPGKRLY